LAASFVSGRASPIPRQLPPSPMMVLPVRVERACDVPVYRRTAVPGSALPDDLRGLGYDVITAGDGERVLPHQIIERFSRRADGELEPFTEGSSKPVSVVVVTNAGSQLSSTISASRDLRARKI
jgi:hypothetical protein